jgi:hypothetical protein
LEDHHGQSWDRFSVYLTIGDKHLRELESLVLRITKPTGNKQKGKFGRSENLRRQLARDIKLKQREELYGIIGRALPESTRPQRAAKNGRIPILTKYLSKPCKLKLTYKGKKYRGSVRRDGCIRVGRVAYTSPSTAAAAIIKRPVDGWYYWRFERAPGDWVRLNELRK